MLDKYDVCGLCNPDLYVFSEQLHQMDNDFGGNHIVRTKPELKSAWDALLDVVDDMMQGCYFGEVSDSMLFFFAKKK